MGLSRPDCSIEGGPGSQFHKRVGCRQLDAAYDGSDRRCRPGPVALFSVIGQLPGQCRHGIDRSRVR
ncbi:hypothetical protein XHV734_4635 [Xanthomonas hortorum pv. vitians]|nr:hypothetical protein XHV734_4635 [Xanthomonas hortorum pv. vitians]